MCEDAADIESYTQPKFQEGITCRLDKRHSDYLHACNALHLTAVKGFIRVYDNQTQMTCSHS